MKIFIKKFPLILFLLCTGFILNAQNTQPHLHSNETAHQECPTHATSGQNNYMRQTLRERQSYVDDGRSGTIYIPVRHIIVRKTDGTGGISNTDLQNAMDELNTAYAVANVQFYECSKAYANSDTYYDFNTSEEAKNISSPSSVVFFAIAIGEPCFIKNILLGSDFVIKSIEYAPCNL